MATKTLFKRLFKIVTSNKKSFPYDTSLLTNLIKDIYYKLW